MIIQCFFFFTQKLESILFPGENLSLWDNRSLFYQLANANWKSIGRWCRKCKKVCFGTKVREGETETEWNEMDLKKRRHNWNASVKWKNPQSFTYQWDFEVARELDPLICSAVNLKHVLCMFGISSNSLPPPKKPAIKGRLSSSDVSQIV